MACRPDDKRKRLGVHSKIIDNGALGAAIKKTSREGKFLCAYEKMLLDHLGVTASITHRALIVRASRIALHLELLDEVFSAGKSLVQDDFQHYCAWSNALARMLDRLGLQAPAPANKLDLNSYLESIAT